MCVATEATLIGNFAHLCIIALAGAPNIRHCAIDYEEQE